MLKFLHTADIHLGAKFKYLGEKAVRHREQLKKTFSQVVNKALEEKVDVVLVSGDLFDSNTPSAANFEFVKSQLRVLQENSIKVCLLAGTHDVLDRGSVYLREDFLAGLDNVHLFRDDFKCEYLDLNLTVWGKSNRYSKSSETPIIMLSEPTTKHNILLAHGSVQIEGKSAKDDYPITFEQIRDCSMDYVALGHWHSMGDYSQGKVKCFYSGSPEFLDIDQKGAGNVIIGEISEGGEIKLNPIKVGISDFIQTEIDLGQVGNEEELRTIILKDAYENLIKVVELKGLVRPDLAIDSRKLEQELGEDFFRLRIINNFHLQLDSIDEKDYPEELVVGQFIRMMKKKISESNSESDKKLLEQVLNLGLAELNGKGVI